MGNLYKVGNSWMTIEQVKELETKSTDNVTVESILEEFEDTMKKLREEYNNIKDNIPEEHRVTGLLDINRKKSYAEAILKYRTGAFNTQE